MHRAILLTRFCKQLTTVVILSGGTCLKCLNDTTPLRATAAKHIKDESACQHKKLLNSTKSGKKTKIFTFLWRSISSYLDRDRNVSAPSDFARATWHVATDKPTSRSPARRRDLLCSLSAFQQLSRANVRALVMSSTTGA